MPDVKSIPPALRPYVFHGLELEWENREEAVGECPWCGRASKFYINVESGQWQCKVCSTGSARSGGNVYTFLRILWETSRTVDICPGDFEELAAERRLLFAETLDSWGVRVSALDGGWIVPAYNVTRNRGGEEAHNRGGEEVKGSLSQLYRYAGSGSSRRTMWATPGVSHGLYGVPLYCAEKPAVWLCEGVWDAMALWEAEELLSAADSHHTSVLAVPSCNVFNEAWCPLFAGKDVVLMFDSDYPKTRSEVTLPPAGWDGMRKVSGILASSIHPPRSISCVKWGEDGYDPTRPSGWDVRDVLTSDV